MIAYYVMFSLPFFACLNFVNFSNKLKSFSIFFYLFLLVLFIGLRDQVGGDWNQYINNYNNPVKFDLFAFDIRTDYLYHLSAFLIYNFGYSIHFLNLLLAALFVFSIYKFSIINPSVSLSFLIAFPIFVLILGMGFVRQGVAVSLYLLAITAVLNKDKKLFFIYSITAIFFHKSAFIVFMFYPVFFNKFEIKNYIFPIVLAMATLYLIKYDLLNLYTNYIGANMHTNAAENNMMISKGGFVRVIINVLASFLFLIFSKELTKNNEEKKVFFILAIASILSLFLIQNYSVFIDRINYYFLPIQLFIFSRFPFIFVNKSTIYVIKTLTALFYLLILSVWLNYAIFSFAWIPYSNYLLP